ncbi:hypothetical protein V500_00137 [Pseudogymnoascus sp. VKM F-4518 (FW-2643)]|nr:hypothetical protein V500_00137 [Pseudogymnoascus sp. VKM F-4518 (FW-2643)]
MLTYHVTLVSRVAEAGDGYRYGYGYSIRTTRRAFAVWHVAESSKENGADRAEEYAPDMELSSQEYG